MLRKLDARGGIVTLVLVLGCVTTGAQETAPASAHCHLIQSDELQAIVGDCARNGAGGQQYCGLWSLTSKQRQFNCFGNSYAGLLPGELRGRTTTVLQAVDDKTAVLFKPATEQDGILLLRVIDGTSTGGENQ